MAIKAVTLAVRPLPHQDSLTSEILTTTRNLYLHPPTTIALPSESFSITKHQWHPAPTQPTINTIRQC